MTIANPRSHIICGVCGSNKHLSYHIDPIGSCNNDGVEYPAVFIFCSCCVSVTSLESER